MWEIACGGQRESPGCHYRERHRIGDLPLTPRLGSMCTVVP
jgi:hypothetical protein